MARSSEQAPRGGLGRLLPAWVVLAVFAPPGVAAIPLAGLLLASHPRTGRELLVMGVAGGGGIWWLLQAGELPDQFLRAAVVIAAAALVALTILTRATYSHRTVLAAAIALVATSALLLALGSSWEAVRWWVEYRAGLTARAFVGQAAALMPATPGGHGGPLTLTGSQLADLEAWFDAFTRTLGEFAPALLALQLLAGFAVAGATYRRIAATPVGVLPGRFRDFRFSEHLGWAAVVPLVVVVLPWLAAAKLAAANLLAVAAVLYAVRGMAVAAFGLGVAGVGGFFLWAALIAIFILMLPFVVGGAILLGVLDAGLNLRRRWTTPASR